MEMRDLSRFLGALTVVKIEQQGNDTALIVQKVLGSGFVVDTAKALAMTCVHVLPEEDRHLDIAFHCRDEHGNWFLSLLDKGSYQELDGEDVLLFQCREHDGSIKQGFRSLPVAERDLASAEKVIFAGRPLNHSKVSRPGDVHVTTRSVVGHISAVYEKTADMNLPIIKGMSGGPVISAEGEIVGIALRNVRVGLDMEVVASEKVEGQAGREEYIYGEYQQFAYLLKSHVFANWLSDVVREYPEENI